MFHFLAKVLYFLFQPSSLLLALTLLGAFLWARGKHPRLGRRLVFGGLLLVLLCGFSPLARLVVWPLEARFAAPLLPADRTKIRGILLLGGFEKLVRRPYPVLGLKDSGERLTETLRLAHELPAAKVIFTGGAAGVVFSEDAADDVVREWLVAVGIAPDRLILEAASRDTHENATLTKALVTPAPGDRFVLVTSAFHMPRAVGVFRKAGFDVIPWPVDYQVADADELWHGFERLPEGLRLLDIAVKEWIGLLAYSWSGRTSELWPR